MWSGLKKEALPMLVSREFSFDAAHNLVAYQGQCEKLHGHTWKLRVTLACPVKLDGMAYDFVELKRIVEAEVIARLDHTYLNDILSQPTTENLAAWAWERLESKLPLYEIRVYESPGSFVSYRGTDHEPPPQN